MTTQTQQGVETVGHTLSSLAARYPGRMALAIARAGRRGAGRYDEVSLGELEREANTFADIFAARGIRKGTRTVVMITPGRAFCAAVFGLLKVEAIPVFIDPGIGLKNVGHCMKQVSPTAFLGTMKAQLARHVFGWGRDSLQISLTIDANAVAAVYNRREEETGGHKHRNAMRCLGPPLQVQGGDIAAIAFTSGSTGVPKGVEFDHQNLNAQSELVRELLGPYVAEPHLTTFPLFLLFGPVLGTALILPDMDTSKPAAADPRKLIATIDDYRCRSAFASPVLVRKLGAYCRDTGRRLASMERVLSAGAPSYPHTLATLAASMPAGGEVFTPYGATEALPVSNISSREILTDTNEKTRRGAGVCVGRVLPGLEAAIIPITETPFAEWSDVPKLPVGEIGEITVSGGIVSRAYFNNPSATQHSKIPCRATGGFYHRMGDLGYFDDSGRLWMCGRKSHRVVTSKRVYFTVPCEGVFNTHPEVARTALVGVAGKQDTIPVLCVELAKKKSAKDKERIRRELNALGAQYELTRPIHEVLYHHSFPVDARHNSKIRREALSVWAGRKIPMEKGI